MELRIAEKVDLPHIKRLYLEAFPLRERKPFFMLCSQRRRGLVDFFVVSDDGGFDGLMITTETDGFLFLDYFAVEKNRRGAGTGSKALSELKKRYEGKCVFLEAELPDESSPDNETRLRRIEFYHRNGFTEGIKVSVAGNKMQLLCMGGEASLVDFFGAHAKGMGRVFTKLILNPKELD